MSIKNVKAEKKRNPSQWDAAIADAKERIKRLRQTIQVFQARKKAGDPWPGTATRN
jgi:hypothetical protein